MATIQISLEMRQSMKAFAVQMRDGMKTRIAKALEPISSQLEALHARFDALPVPKDGEDGEDGKSVDLDDVRPILAELVAAIPRAKDGVDGVNADPAETLAMVKAQVAEVVASLPVPKDGVDGKSVDRDEVRAMVAELVAEIPKPRDGVDGVDGIDGIGKDAADITVLSEIDEAKVYAKGTFACYRGGLIRATRKTSPIADDLEAAGWQVIMNGIAEETEEATVNGTVKRVTAYTSGKSMTRWLKLANDFGPELQSLFSAWRTEADAMALEHIDQAIARIPRPRDGEDGKPGNSIEDFDIAIKDRTLGVAMRIGGEVVMREVKLDMAIDRGVYQSGKKYQRGDIVTYTGSAFIAQVDTDDKPETSKAWRMFVKRGRDGKDAPALEAIEP